MKKINKDNKHEEAEFEIFKADLQKANMVAQQMWISSRSHIHALLIIHGGVMINAMNTLSSKNISILNIRLIILSTLIGIISTLLCYGVHSEKIDCDFKNKNNKKYRWYLFISYITLVVTFLIIILSLHFLGYHRNR